MPRRGWRGCEAFADPFFRARPKDYFDGSFEAWDFWVVVIITVVTKIAEAASVRGVMGSPRRSQPRKTATRGFT